MTAHELLVNTFELKDNQRDLEPTAKYVVEFDRTPEAESLKGALAFLADVMRTLVQKENGYGNITEHVAVFAPDCTAEQRIRTRLDEKLTRLKRLGIDDTSDSEDTLRDIAGYLALLRGVRSANGGSR